jgi:hypothetical protein
LEGVIELHKSNLLLRCITIALVVLALASCIALLAKDAGVGALLRLPRSAISAAPLLLVGASFLILQTTICPRLMELLKNGLLAATFLLWGAVQLMPRNPTSIRLGNVVIALYVLDLAWVILGSKNSREKN